MKAIINGYVLVGSIFYEDKVLLFDECIMDILNKNEFRKQYEDHEGIEVIDARHNYVVPGMIDVHIHGYEGDDASDGDVEGILRIAKGIAANGVTAFLPTTMTMSLEEIHRALGAIRTAMDKANDGAMILGCHLEGPFINPKKKGAQPEESIIEPKLDLIEAYMDVIKIVTLAPEVKGATELIKSLKDECRISIGHTEATYDEVTTAVEAGASGMTHLFNAMTGLNHREPGVVGFALNNDVYAEIIADGHHIHPGIFPSILRAKTVDRIMLVTDCIRAGGLNEGKYSLGGQEVSVTEGRCTLSDGTLAGSVLKLNEALALFGRYVDAEIAELIHMVSRTPAKYLGVEDRMGDLQMGKLANIVIMDPYCQIMKTIVKGTIVYENRV